MIHKTTLQWDRRLATIALLCVGLFQLGCSAASKPSRLEKNLANMAKGLIIPIEAKGLQNPLPPIEQVIRQGREIYGQYCVLCHGTDGRSNTKLGQSMYPPAMDLTSPHVQSWSDGELFWIIQNGVRMTGMPSWKAFLSEADTWKLVHFIHSLPSASIPNAVSQEERKPADLLRYGRTLFRQEGCFICHRLDGEGGEVGPDLTYEAARGRRDEWLITQLRDPQSHRKDSVMPSFKNLTDEQLHALVALLQHRKSTVPRKDAPEDERLADNSPPSRELGISGGTGIPACP